MQWFQRKSHLNGLKSQVDVNCERKDGRKDGRTENQTSMSHTAKGGATKMVAREHNIYHTSTKALTDMIEVISKIISTKYEGGLNYCHF